MMIESVFDYLYTFGTKTKLRLKSDSRPFEILSYFNAKLQGRPFTIDTQRKSDTR